MDRKTILQRLIDQTQQSYQYVNAKSINKDFNPIHSTFFKRAQILHLGKSNLKAPRHYLIEHKKDQTPPSIRQHNSFTVSIQKHDGTKSQRAASYYRQQMEKQKSLKSPFVPLLSPKLIRLKQTQYQKINDIDSEQEKQLIISNQLDSLSALKLQYTSVDSFDNESPQTKFSGKFSEQFNSNPQNKSSSRRNRQYLIKNVPKSYQFGVNKNTSMKMTKNFQQKCEQTKKMKAIARKQLHKHYAKPFIQPPKITSASYIIYQCASQQTSRAQLHFAYQSKNPVEIASLTKIMTCILAIEISHNFGISIQEQKITITSYQSNLPGTSANIQPGDIYTIQQLLYGLMLPSGNDASFAIAIYMGNKLLYSDHKKSVCKEISSGTNEFSKRNSYFRFIGQMNKKANELGMTKTKYANSHGLANQFNKSCCYDLAILCNYALKNKIFSNIVKSKNFECTISALKSNQCEQENQSSQVLDINEQNKLMKSIIDNQQADIQVEEKQQGQFEQRKQQEQVESEIKDKKYYQKYIYWENTHKLLHEKDSQYIGIKTGVTRTAGPCLASCLISPQGRKFIIIILNCKNMKWRFMETQILKKWVYRKQGIVIKKSKQLKILDYNSIEEQIFQNQEPTFHSLQNIPI